MRTARAALSWMALAVVACGGDDDAPPGDGGGSRDSPIDAQSITPPMPDPPAPPVLTPCPPGWREIDVDGVAACDPWPSGGRMDCPAGVAHFPGEPNCTTVGCHNGFAAAYGFGLETPERAYAILVGAPCELDEPPTDPLRVFVRK